MSVGNWWVEEEDDASSCEGVGESEISRKIYFIVHKTDNYNTE